MLETLILRQLPHRSCHVFFLVHFIVGLKFPQNISTFRRNHRSGTRPVPPLDSTDLKSTCVVHKESDESPLLKVIEYLPPLYYLLLAHKVEQVDQESCPLISPQNLCPPSLFTLHISPLITFSLSPLLFLKPHFWVFPLSLSYHSPTLFTLSTPKN